MLHRAFGCRVSTPSRQQIRTPECKDTVFAPCLSSLHFNTPLGRMLLTAHQEHTHSGMDGSPKSARPCPLFLAWALWGQHSSMQLFSHHETGRVFGCRTYTEGQLFIKLQIAPGASKPSFWVWVFWVKIHLGRRKRAFS